MQTEVTDVTVQTNAVATLEQSVQPFESENDHTYAKSFADYCCEDNLEEIDKFYNCHELDKEGDGQFINIHVDEVLVESLSFKDFASEITKN